MKYVELTNVHPFTKVVTGGVLDISPGDVTGTQTITLTRFKGDKIGETYYNVDDANIRYIGDGD